MMNKLIFSTIRVPRLSVNAPKLFSTTSWNHDAVTVPVDYMPDKLFKQIDLELRAHEPSVLKSYSWFAGTAAKELNLKVSKSWAPEEPHKERKTLLKAAYVNKKHRVQYEMRTYYHFMTLEKLTGSTADTYLEYIQRNLPEGVSMKVVKHEVKKIFPSISKPPHEQDD